MVSDVGIDPAPARKIVALGLHPLRIIKDDRNDRFAIDALAHIFPDRIWLCILNAFAIDAENKLFDPLSVSEHVTPNRETAIRCFARTGSASSPYENINPLLPHAFSNAPLPPHPIPYRVARSQSL